jgi:uncharacterized protein YqgV (UPF0045/DUF77 family)
MNVKTTAEIEIHTIGDGVPQRDRIQQACAIIDKTKLESTVHEMGTTVTGELPELLSAVHEIHHALHEGGSPRVSTRLSIETRID